VTAGFLFLLFLLVVYLPVLALVAESLAALAGDPVPYLSLLLPLGRRAGLLLVSTALGLAVAATCVLTGVPAATWLWRHRSGVPGLMRWLLVLMLPVSAVLHALAWTTAGRVLSGLLPGPGGGPVPLHGWGITWWVQSMLLLPVATGIILVGLELVDPDLLDAARIPRSDMAAYTRVVLPLAGPFVAAAAGLVFLLSVTDYSVPSLFSVNVYALEIFADFSATASPVSALFLALPLMALTALVVILSQYRLRRAFQKAAWYRATWNVPLEWPAWFRTAQGAGVALLLLAAGVPLAALAWDALAGPACPGCTLPATGEITFSVATALLAAVISLPLAAGAGAFMARGGPGGRAAWVLSLLPLAIPAPLAGIAILSVAGVTGLSSGVAGPLLPALAGVVRFAPVAALILCAQIRFTEPALLDAARVFSGTLHRTLTDILLPLMLPGLAFAAGMVFSLTLGELGATLLVLPPGSGTLTLRLYNYLHYGATASVASVGLVLAALVAGAGILVLVVLRGTVQGRQNRKTASRRGQST
jgi:iron(III) transport system permease protein